MWEGAQPLNFPGAGFNQLIKVGGATMARPRAQSQQLIYRPKIGTPSVEQGTEVTIEDAERFNLTPNPVFENVPEITQWWEGPEYLKKTKKLNTQEFEEYQKGSGLSPKPQYAYEELMTIQRKGIARPTSELLNNILSQRERIQSLTGSQAQKLKQAQLQRSALASANLSALTQSSELSSALSLFQEPALSSANMSALLTGQQLRQEQRLKQEQRLDQINLYDMLGLSQLAQNENGARNENENATKMDITNQINMSSLFKLNDEEEKKRRRGAKYYNYLEISPAPTPRGEMEIKIIVKEIRKAF